MLNRKVLLVTAALCVCAVAVNAGEVVLTTTEYPKINATALDQPELYAVLVDPNTGQMIMDANNPSNPALIECFVDTGASGFVFSYMHSTAHQGVVNLNFNPQTDYIGTFDETGVAGQETGNVTRNFGVQVINTVPGESQTIETNNGFMAGDYNLWVRQQIGMGETVSTGGAYDDPDEIYAMLEEYALGGVSTDISDPINIIGMPAISQRVMVMDPTSLSMDIGGLLGGGLDPNAQTSVSRMTTRLMTPQEASQIDTNVTFELEMHNFTGAPTGVHPSFTSNPVFKNVTISNNGLSDTTGDDAIGWLFDTGAGGTMLSFEKAQAVGLIGNEFANLEEFMATYTGPTSEVGGIGEGTLIVPLLEIDQIRIPTKEGFDMVWENVTISVIDVAGLDGVFGMNMLLPAMTIDSTEMESIVASLEGSDQTAASQALLDLMNMLSDTSPGYFEKIVFDSTDFNNVELKLYSPAVPEPATAGVVLIGGVCLIAMKRRKR